MTLSGKDFSSTTAWSPCRSLLALPPTLFLVLGETGVLKIHPERCTGSRHALWLSLVDLKSVCPGVPVRLSRQQYLLINLFIDLLGCTWGFSWEELQTCVPPSIQPSVRLKFGLQRPQGLEWAALEPGQSPRGLLGRAVGALKAGGPWVRKWAHSSSARDPGIKQRPLDLCDVALLLWASPCGEVLQTHGLSERSAHIPLRNGSSPAQRCLRSLPPRGRGWRTIQGL